MKPNFVNRRMIARSFVFEFIGLILFLTAFSRGLFEVFLPKTLAYVIQLSAIFSWMFFAYLQRWVYVSIEKRSGLGFFVFALIPACLSSILTVFISGNLGGPFYFFIFLIIIAVFCSGLVFRLSAGASAVLMMMSISIVILVLVAILQQVGFFPELPGISWYGGVIRPSSLTGSMLHYPIIISIMSLVLLNAALCGWGRIYGVIAGIGILAVFVSFSRSGILIILVALAWLGARVINKRILLVLAGLAFVAVLGFLIARSINDELADSYIGRVTEILDFKEAANEGRFGTWSQAIEIFSKGPILVSNETGEYTNATANFNMTQELFVGESTFFTLLLNFGVITAVIFYCGLIRMLVNLKLTILGTGILLAVIVQSFVYQSFEVLPFVFVVALAISGIRLNNDLACNGVVFGGGKFLRRSDRIS